MNVFELQAILTLDSSKYDSGLDSAKGKVSGLGTAMKTFAVAAAAKAAEAVVQFGKDSVSAGMNFDKSMSQVAATMGTTVDQIQDLRAFAQEMGRTTAFSATEAADALNYMALAGYDAETSMATLPTVLNLAAAGGMDLARASDMITDSQSALNLTQAETNALVDQMAVAASKTNTSVEQLGDAILTVGGTANIMANGTQELNMVLGTLADNGIKGSEAGTHLRNILLSMAAPTDKAAKALDDLGVNIFDAEGKMRSFTDIFPDLNDALSELSDQEKIDAISTIFNSRDIASVNALLDTSVDRWNELSDAIGDSAGAAERMADTQLDNLAGDITLFKSAVEGAQIAVSDSLSPALREVMQTATEDVTRLTEAFEEGGIAGAVREFGSVAAEGIDSLTDKIPEIVDVIIELIPAVGDAAGQIGAALAEGTLKGAVSLLKSVPDLLLGVFKGAAEGFDSFFDGILSNFSTQMTEAEAKAVDEGAKLNSAFAEMERERAASAEAAAKTAEEAAEAEISAAKAEAAALKELQDAWDSAYKSAKESAGKQFSLFEKVPEIVHKAVGEAQSALADMSSSLESQSKYWNDYADNIQKAMEMGVDEGLIAKLSDGSKESAQLLADIVESGEDSIGELNEQFAKVEEGEQRFAEAVANMQTGMEQSAGPMATAAQTVVDGAIQPFEKAADETHSIGVNFALGFAEGISSQLSVIISAAAEAGDAAKAALKEALGIASPSKEAKKLGVFFDQGFAAGLEDGYAEITEEMVIQNRNMLNYWGRAIADGTAELSDEMARDLEQMRAVISGYAVQQNREIAKITVDSFGIVVEGGKLGVAQVGNTWAELFDSLGTITRQNTEQAAELVYKFGKNEIDKLVKYSDLSVSEEIRMLEELQSVFVENSKEYNEIAEALEDRRYKQRNEHLKNLEDAEKDYYDSLEDFEDRVKDIYDEIDAIQQEYADAVADRASQLSGTWGLFEEVQEQEPVKGTDLIKNLRDQVNALEEYGDVMASLEERGIEGALLEELRELGPDSLAELKALAILSDEQLEEYAALYGEKQEKGNELALHELEDLKTETLEKQQALIDDVNTLFETEAPEIGETFAAAIAAGMDSGIPEVEAAAERMFNAARDTFYSGLGLSASESGVLQTNKVSFDESALGTGSAAIVNSNAAVGRTPVAVRAELRLPDNSLLAEYMLDNGLIETADANGTPILNPIDV